MSSNMLLLLHCYLSLCVCQKTIITSGVDWQDDYQFDENGINGWHIYRTPQFGSNITDYYSPQNIQFTVGANKYHGVFDGTTYAVTIIQRYFQCTTTSHIQVKYGFGSCNTENGDKVKLWYINEYVFSSSRRNSILTGYSIENNTEGIALLNYLKTNVQNTSNWGDGSLNWLGVMPSGKAYVLTGEPFLITLSMSISDSNSDEYGFMTDIGISCITTTTTAEPSSSPTTLSTTPTTSPTSNPTFIPTTYPTYIPTYPSTNPTYIPTSIPTNIPTSNPVTNIPSISPTTDVPTTIYPSFFPSTSIPSISPTVTDVTEESVKNTVDDKLTTGEELSTILYIITGVIILLLVVVIIIMLIFIARRRNKMKPQNNMEEMASISTPSVQVNTIANNEKNEPEMMKIKNDMEGGSNDTDVTPGLLKLASIVADAEPKHNRGNDDNLLNEDENMDDGEAMYDSSNNTEHLFDVSNTTKGNVTSGK